MDKIELTKQIIRFVVGVGTYRITREIIERNTTAKGPIDNVARTAGSVAAGLYVSDAIGDYTDRQVENLVGQWRGYEIKKPNN